MTRAIHPGELITCEQGHVVAEVLPVVVGVDDPEVVRIGLWRPGGRRSWDAVACVCSAPFRRDGAWHVGSRGWVNE